MAKKKPLIKIDRAELVHNFRTAKDKRMQIDIEADLHCCSPRAIAEELYLAGALADTGIMPWQFSDEYVPIPPARPHTNGPKQTFDEARAQMLFDEGVSYARMAKALGVTDAAVKKWAARRGLKRKPAPGSKQTKEDDMTQDSDAKFKEIIESVDAGMRCVPCEPTQPECGDCAKDKPQITTSRSEPCDSCVCPARETCEGCEHAASVALPKPPANIRMEPREDAGAWEGYTVPEPVRERSAMTVGDFVRAFGRYLTESVADAPLCINGTPLRHDLEFTISVRNEQVFVDLLTRGCA